LIQKLKGHAQTEEELTSVIEWLVSNGFVNESRVIESVIHRRANKLGFARVAKELQEKGLPNQEVQEAVSNLRQTEEQRAREVWRKRFKAKAEDAKERAKHMRFLLSRGFEARAVQRVLNTAHDNLECETQTEFSDDM
jgi:regulatory protein